MTNINHHKVYIKSSLVLLVLCFISLKLLTAQEKVTNQDQESNLYIIANPLYDSIQLRWAASNFQYWDLGNTFGFTLTRFTILKDSALLEKPIEAGLNSEPLKPLPLQSWEPLVQEYEYAAIAAQAIYGKSFDIEADGLTPESAFNKSKEQQQRFAFAQHAADMSPIVAKASGLLFTDVKVVPGEKYVYRLTLNLPDSLQHLNDTATIFVGLDDYEPLPTPIECSIESEDKVAKITWNTFAQNNIYLAWQLERSDDKGKTFNAITSKPIVPINAPGKDMEYTIRVDSLPAYNKEFRYRLRGISTFGEYGPWSNILKITATEKLKSSPIIKEYIEEDGKVKLVWEFPEEHEYNLEKFKILRNPSNAGAYTEIEENIKITQREFWDKSPLSTAYYKVVAIAPNKNTIESPAYLVQISDEIPPMPPKELLGTADSLRKIHLKWKANNEADLYGYAVFKSASGKDEYTLITRTPIKENYYTDSVQKNDLNSGVFYKVVAYDQRFNQSGFSEVCYVNKVDKIPPSFPVINKCKAVEEGIELSWINSTSSDVASHTIYRIQTGDSTWVVLVEIPLKKDEEESTYTDNTCSKTKTNQYKVIAKDHAGNFSQPATSIAIKGLRNLKAKGLEKITYKTDSEKGKVKISWKLPNEDVKHIKVYKQTGTNSYGVLETLGKESTSIEDYGLKLGETYKYRIKLYYVDGMVSGFSNEIKVEL